MNQPAERRYHVAHRGRKFGPFTLFQLTARNLAEDMLVWYEGSPEWRPITEIEELRGYVRRATTTRTTAPPASLGSGPGRLSGSPETLAGEPGEAAGPMLPPLPQDALAAAARPSSRIVKAIGILSIVFGTLGLVCCPFSIFGLITNDWSGDPAIKELFGQPHVFGMRLILNVVWLILSLPELLAGIGLTKGKAWGRMLAMVVSVACLATYLISFLFECAMVQIPMLQQGALGDSDETLGIAVLVILMHVIGSVVALIYHAVVLILLNRKSVKESLA